MKVISKISLTENVAIVSFEKVPARIGFLSDLFDRVARAGINVDMISQTAPKGEQNTLAFTVSDGDVPRILSTVTALKGGESGMMPLVSSGNIKIVFGNAQQGRRGRRGVQHSEGGGNRSSADHYLGCGHFPGSQRP